jgi:steroid Delta-isomerase
MRSNDARVDRTIHFFETLTPAALAALDDLYATDARFKDPFNDVAGVVAIRQVFEHMYATLDGPRFEVREALVDGDRCFLSWDFHFRFKRFRGGPQVMHGGSMIHFGAGGRIVLHRDYWDAAEELYEKLPLIGALMRWLKARARR